MENKPRNTTSKIVLIVIAIVLIAFTVTMIITFWHNQSTPDVLITAVFTACLGEFGFLAWIRNTKQRYINPTMDQPNEYDHVMTDEDMEDEEDVDGVD